MLEIVLEAVNVPERFYNPVNENNRKWKEGADAISFPKRRKRAYPLFLFRYGIYLHVLDQDEKNNVFDKFQYLTETSTFVMLIIIQDYKLPVIHCFLCSPFWEKATPC